MNTSKRADWEKHKNYPPQWSWATWPERGMIIVVWLISGLIGAAIALAILFIIGESIDGISRYNSEHRRCLQKATTGYEIERCR